MHCQYLVMNTYKSIYNVNQMLFYQYLLFLRSDCIFLRSDCIFSQFLIITKQSHTCVLTFQNQKMGLRRLWKKQARMHFIGLCQIIKKIKAIVEAYTTKRECSVQETVYLIMPELLLWKTFLKVMFLNSNLRRIFHKKGRPWWTIRW